MIVFVVLFTQHPYRRKVCRQTDRHCSTVYVYKNPNHGYNCHSYKLDKNHIILIEKLLALAFGPSGLSKLEINLIIY